MAQAVSSKIRWWLWPGSNDEPSLVLIWGPVAVWMAIMFWFSSQASLPSAPDSFLDLLMKKGAHFSEYAVLAALWIRAFRAVNWPRGSLSAILAFALTIAYATSDEFHQSFVPNRHPMVTDVFIDGFGALVAIAVFLLSSRRHRDVSE